MTEYITKEQAIDEVWDAFTSHDDPDLGRVIEENIKRLPAADVAPIVYGSWVWRSYPCSMGSVSVLECSACGRELPRVLAREGRYPPRCQYCGAIMLVTMQKGR